MPAPSRLQSVSLFIIASVAAATALIYTKTIMVPFVLALLICFIVAPGIETFERRLRLPRALAIVLMFMLIAVGFGLLSAILTGTAREALANFEAYRNKVTLVSEQLFHFLADLGITVSIEEMRQSLRELPFFTMAKSTITKLTDFVSNAFLITIFVVFLLTGKTPKLPEGSIIHQVNTKIRVYLVTKAVTSSVTGLLTAVILLMLGIDMAIMFGILAFLLNFIPTVGSIFAVIIPLPIAILQYGLGWQTIATIALPGVVQMTIGNIIEPKIMGDSLDLHPVTIMLFLMFWGLIWGIPGMILATPFAVIIKIALDNSTSMDSLGKVMAGRLPD